MKLTEELLKYGSMNVYNREIAEEIVGEAEEKGHMFDVLDLKDSYLIVRAKH